MQSASIDQRVQVHAGPKDLHHTSISFSLTPSTHGFPIPRKLRFDLYAMAEAVGMLSYV